MKKIVSLLLAFLFVFSLTACDGINTPGRDVPDPGTDPVNCAPGYFEENGGCVEEVTEDDCAVNEMVLDNICVVDPNYVAPEFPELLGPDYNDLGYDDYEGRDIVNDDCSALDNIGEWQPVWCDEFNYEGLPDNTKWGYDVGGHGWGNNELQYYTGSDIDNAYVDNGYLTIEAFKENIGGREYSSARLITKNKAEWLYGKVQVRAKVPGGKGTWPAIWLLPTDWEYGGWPDSGEIDVMEYVGYGKDVLHSTIHTGAFNHSIGTQVGKSRTVQGMEDEFHVYEMEWEPNVIRFYVDGILFYTVSYDPDDSSNVAPWEAWSFDKDFHLIINLAFGGNWGGATGIDESLDHMKFEVDYVRVYQKDYAGMDTENPDPVTNIRNLNQNASQSFIAWDVANDDVMIQHYEVYVNDVLHENATHNASIIPAGITETQTIKVIPVDFAGNKGLPQTLVIDAPSTPTVLDKIEAEMYVSMSGVQTESTSDAGGGLNVGYIDTNDYMTYVIEVLESGQYQIKARVASEALGGEFTIYKDGSEIGTATFSATGGWQNWQDAHSSLFNLSPGTYEFKIKAESEGWNINYFEFVKTN